MTRSTSQLSAGRRGRGSFGSLVAFDLLYLERATAIFVSAHSGFAAKPGKKRKKETLAPTLLGVGSRVLSHRWSLFFDGFADVTDALLSSVFTGSKGTWVAECPSARHAHAVPVSRFTQPELIHLLKPFQLFNFFFFAEERVRVIQTKKGKKKINRAN